jgi:hypothetical protein
MILPTPPFRQPALHEGSIRKVANELFCDFFQQNPSAEMVVLEFIVERIHPGPFYEDALESVSVRVIRASRDMVPTLGGGGYESKVKRSMVAA